MRIVHVLYSGLGGHFSVFSSLIDGGFCSDSRHFVCLAGVEQPALDFQERLKSLNLPYCYVERFNKFGWIGYQLKVYRVLSSANPNLIFSHGASTFLGVILYRFRCFLRGESAKLIYRDTQCHSLKSWSEWVLMLFMYKYASVVVHLTDESMSFPFSSIVTRMLSAKRRVIPNGLDLEKYKPAMNRLKVNSRLYFKFGMQSRLQSNKDHVTLLRAFRLLLDTHPTDDFRLEIAGSGSTQSLIEELISSLGLSESVQMRGLLPEHELASFLGDLDVYVHCSHGETMSTAIMQAIASGLPVIASNVSGVANMIKPSFGFLYKPCDSNELFRRMECLSLDSDLCHKMGKEARAHAVDCFSNKRVASMYTDLVVQLALTF